MKYAELMKRKDRRIENCQDIKSVLADFKNDILTIEDAKNMLYLAMQEIRAESYKSGWAKEKTIKKKR